MRTLGHIGALAATLALATLPTLGLGCSTADDATSAEAPADGENDRFTATGKLDANGVEEHSAEGTCVLNLANKATLKELDDDVGLLGVAARGIVAYRAGADGKEGTADDRAFENLDQLDGVSWVGLLSFTWMKSYAVANGYCPVIAEETVPPGEAAAIQAVIASAMTHVKGQHDAGARPSKRDAHPKAHGCVTAFVDVDPAALPAELRVGLFAQAATYPAWIRFSNGSFTVSPDSDGDIRGMAIKLMDVPGKKLLEAEADALTHDFLLINTPTLMVRNALDYVEFSQKAFDGNPVSFFAKLNPDEWHFRELLIVLNVLRKTIASPLLSRYWSTVPFLLGPDNAVKYTARPCDGESDKRPNDAGDDYLSEVLSAHLMNKDACFDFMVQRQTDATAMPIEDPSVNWSEERSPFIKVATIRIPAQTFLSAKQVDFCENLSFTPWHALPEHRPLGGINRVRRLIYDAISSQRHGYNAVERHEPTSHSLD